MSAPALSPPLKIGAVARRSGVSVKTIRFYCDEGLMQPVGRSDGGYRLFNEEVLVDLSLIRTLRAMEIPLQDVGQILTSRRSGVCTCAALQAELFAMLDSWEACGGRSPGGSRVVLARAG